MCEKENKKMSSKTSLDEKLSDLVGTSKYKINENIDLTYNFSVDQNLNRNNELSTNRCNYDQTNKNRF